MTSLRRRRSEEIETFDPQARCFAQDGREYENFAAYLKDEPTKSIYNGALRSFRALKMPEEGLALFTDHYRRSKNSPKLAAIDAAEFLRDWFELQNDARSLSWFSGTASSGGAPEP